MSGDGRIFFFPDSQLVCVQDEPQNYYKDLSEEMRRSRLLYFDAHNLDKIELEFCFTNSPIEHNMSVKEYLRSNKEGNHSSLIFWQRNPESDIKKKQELNFKLHDVVKVESRLESRFREIILAIGEEVRHNCVQLW